MVRGTLYDIENHNDFYDSLHIMESMEDGKFDLIFIELPPLITPTSFIYNTENCSKISGTSIHKITGSVNIRSSFLCKCIENACRILSGDGILVLYTHKYTYTTLDYLLLLNQFFPSIYDIVLYNNNHQFSINQLFICSKHTDYSFPTESLCLSDFYPYKNELGLFREEQAFNFHTNKKSYYYTWKGIKSPTPLGWIYPKDTMDELWNSDRIIIKNGKILIKKYRTEEKTNISTKDQLIWEIPERSFSDKGYWRTCDPLSLDRVFSIFCKPNDLVFCPFDYCNLFPYMADKQDLIWTSIQSHTMYHFINHFFDLPNNKYKTVTKLPATNDVKKYRTDIIMTPQELDKFKAQINTLATSIHTVKTVLQINSENNDSIPFENLKIDEDILAERFHDYIISNMTSEMLDSVSSIAEQEYATCWDRLESKSQKYLKSALALSRIINPADIDGASVLVELFKTLESELYIKLFLSYAIRLKKENVSMTSKYKNMNSDRETREFWNYLHQYIAQNKESHLSLGRMNDILERTLAKNPKKSLYKDFQKYLHSILTPAFFEKNFTKDIFWLTNVRNEGVHKDFTSQTELEKCTQIINEKLNHLLCNLSVMPDKSIAKTKSNLTDNMHKNSFDNSTCKTEKSRATH